MDSTKSRNIKKTIRLMKQGLPDAIKQRRKNNQIANELYRQTTDLEPDSLNYVLTELLVNLIMDQEVNPLTFIDGLSLSIADWFTPLAEC